MGWGESLDAVAVWIHLPAIFLEKSRWWGDERIVPIWLAITELAVVCSDIQRLPMNGLRPKDLCPVWLRIYDWQSHKQD
jgi:hypothetical protein